MGLMIWLASMELDTTSASIGVNRRKFSPLRSVISTSSLWAKIWSSLRAA
jgi:hypothetical protein